MVENTLLLILIGLGVSAAVKEYMWQRLTRNLEQTSVRLGNTVSPQEGVLEAMDEKHPVWRPVCGDNWGKQEAMVACRSLGFWESYNDSVAVHTVNRGQLSTYVNSYQCKGDETDLNQCLRTNNTCSGAVLASVRCQPTTLRLMKFNNIDTNIGYVEMYIDGQWGSVCASNFDQNAALVVCRTLGFKESEPVKLLTPGTYGGSKGIIGNSTCKGSENDFIDCNFDYNNGSALCDSMATATIMCGTTEMRLVGGTGSWEGRLEVKYNGQFGTVCEDGFNQKAANVACRNLGYYLLRGEDAEIFNSNKFGPGSGQIVLDDINCTGIEDDINACTHENWGTSNCFNYEDVGISCPHFDIRLDPKGRGPWEGVVKVFHDGRWGIIKSGTNTKTDAESICRQLGYNASEVSDRRVDVVTIGNYARWIYAWMGYLHCDKSVDNIGKCIRPSWHWSITSGAGRGSSLSVRCPRGNFTTPVRLTGSNPWSGLVQLELSGTWNNMCYSGSWGPQEAAVICSMLGFGRHGVGNSHTSLGLWGIVWDIGCRGDEADIVDCPVNSIWSAPQRCSSSKVVGVTCDVPPPPKIDSVRLAGGAFPWEGRVEVLSSGKWGTICDETWDINAARVVCAQLQFASKHVVVLNGTYYGPGNGTITIPSLTCNGAETDLNNCVLQPTESSNTCTHAQDAGLKCINYDIPDTVSASCTNTSWDIQVDMSLVKAYQSGAISGLISLGPNCTGNQYGDILKFDYPLTACYTLKETRGRETVYRNRLAYNNILNGSTTGSSTIWKVNVECVIPQAMTTTPTPTTTTTIPVTAIDPNTVSLSVSYMSDSYQMVQGNPMDIKSQTTVFVEVKPILQSVKMIVKNCTVHFGQAWGQEKTLLKNGCEVFDGVTVTRLLDNETRFLLQTNWYTGTESLLVQCTADTSCSPSDKSARCKLGCHTNPGIVG